MDVRIDSARHDEETGDISSLAVRCEVLSKGCDVAVSDEQVGIKRIASRHQRSILE